jgi:hypothetical protein
MAKKQWETVMLSKETKDRLKELKGNRTYEEFISSLVTNYNAAVNPGHTPCIDFDRLISEYLEPMKAYMKENTPGEQIMRQVEQFTEDFNRMEAELTMARKRINILSQENDRLKKKRNRQGIR